MARPPSPRDEAARRRGWDADDGAAPWLQAAEPDETVTHTLIGRRALWLILIGLLILAAGVAVGIILITKRSDQAIDIPPPGAELPLVKAPGAWKVAPSQEEARGSQIEGQDQLVYGTGSGGDPGGQIALDALPEAPLPRPGSDVAPNPMTGGGEPKDLLPPAPAAMPSAAPATMPPPAPAPPRPADQAKVAPAKAAPPKVAPAATEPVDAAPGSAGGSIIQLGAFSSEARARNAWNDMTGRFSYLAGLQPLIVPVTRDGTTLWRLRSTASGPAQARDICARLKVAGESCAVVG